MGVRVRPDDDVYRINAVWLGPTGWTWPWQARYMAYVVWLALFTAILIVEAVTPLSIGLPPVWELCIAVLGTYGLMTVVTHDRPLRSLWQTTAGELRNVRVRPLRLWLWTFAALLLLALLTPAGIGVPPLWEAVTASAITWAVSALATRPDRPDRAVAAARITVLERP